MNLLWNLFLKNQSHLYFPDQPGLWLPPRSAAMGDREAVDSGPGDVIQPRRPCRWRQSFPLYPLRQRCLSDTTTTQAGSGSAAYRRWAADGVKITSDEWIGLYPFCWTHAAHIGAWLNHKEYWFIFRDCRIDSVNATLKQRSNCRWGQDRAYLRDSTSSSPSSKTCSGS